MTLLARAAFVLGAVGVVTIVAGVLGPALGLFSFSPAPVVPVAAVLVPVAFTTAFVLREARDLRSRRDAR